MEKVNDSELLKQNILKIINDKNSLASIDYSLEQKLDHQQVVGALKSLEMLGKVILTQKEKKYFSILQDGQSVIQNGCPENVLMKYVLENSKEKPLKQSDIKGKLPKDAETRGFSIAMKNKLISLDKESNIVINNKDYNPNIDPIRDQMLAIQSNPSNLEIFDEKAINELVKNKYIKKDTTKYFEVIKGEHFSLDIVKPESDLTTELIAEGKYLTKTFKAYNYKTQGVEVVNGALHPLLRVRTQFREILLELGFQEMPTNNFVESSFWNFDSLFQPQQHPARDAHDTFFLKQPQYSERLKTDYPEYLKEVKKVHEEGGYGSLGWRYKFSEEEATKNILRTHTTAVSSKMLYRLAQEYKKTGKFTPKKFFSIDRVFRNETLDSTHLCEFHQIEGVVADYDLGLGHLIGTIEDFFHKFGIKKLRFKPAYNPYTEPSMEIFSYHEKSKKWVEIGNSGVFRPEMLAPMGLPENVSVIAWGLSLERPTMIHYKYSSIKELFGEEVQLRDTKNAKLYCINLN